MNTRVLAWTVAAAALSLTATTALPQGYFGGDALANYQQLLDYDFDEVNPPAGRAFVAVYNPTNPAINFAHAKAHAVQGGPTRAIAAVQGFAPALPPPGPGDFMGLAAAGSV